jgi:hypothetical protein
LVVVSRSNAIGHSILHICRDRILNRSKCGIRVLPLDFILIAVLCAVAQLRDENDVATGDVT